jgi:xylulokinase
LDTLAAQVSDIHAMRLIGGGSRGLLWRQILADCLRLPIQALSLKSEATAWGAAVAGGVAVGLYRWEIAAQQAQVIETVEPDPTHMPLYDELAAVYADSYTALSPIYERLHRFSERG